MSWLLRLVKSRGDINATGIPFEAKVAKIAASHTPEPMIITSNDPPLMRSNWHLRDLGFDMTLI